VAVFAFLLASAAGLVVNRASRADVTWTSLATYVMMLIGRSLWLDDPLSIPLHRLGNGALVLFAFFMISPPGPRFARPGGPVDVFVTRLHVAVRRRALPRRPGLPGDGRSHQLPGPLHSSPPLEGR
jgi:hypothetical protein